MEEPLVLQCIKCRTVLSDSTQIISTEQALQAVVVKGATNLVVREEKQNAAPLGDDNRCKPYVHSCSNQDWTAPAAPQCSSYQDLACANCTALVGCLYQGLQEPYQHLQQLFVLHVPAMSSYELRRSISVKAPGAPEEMQLAVASSPDQPAGQPDMLSRVAQLESSLTQVQQMLLLHQERLSVLESLTGRASAAAGRGNTPQPATRGRGRSGRQAWFAQY